MKRFFVFIALFLGISAFVSAQPRAIGGRLGYDLEVSYQHSLGNNFIELDAGLIGFGSGVQATGIYDFVIITPNWTPKGEWNFYAGPGLTLGYRWHDKLWGWDDDYYYYSNNWTSAAIFGVSGQVGLDYTFPFNLQLAVDYRPLFGIAVGDNAGSWNANKGKYNDARFYKEGFYNFAVSVRYRF